MSNKALAAKAANLVSYVAVSETANHYVRMAVMCGKDTRNTNSERMFKQVGHKCAYLHELQNRINNLTDLWHVFDRIQFDTLEEEEEAIMRLTAIDNVLVKMAEINLVDITTAAVKKYRKLEQEIEENAMAVYCAFDAIVNA